MNGCRIGNSRLSLIALVLAGCVGNGAQETPNTTPSAYDALAGGNGEDTPRSAGYILIAPNPAVADLFAREVTDEASQVAFVFHAFAFHAIQISASQVQYVTIEKLNGTIWTAVDFPNQLPFAQALWTPFNTGVYRLVVHRFPRQASRISAQAVAHSSARYCLLGNPNFRDIQATESYRLGAIPVETTDVYLHNAVVHQYSDYARYNEGNPAVVGVAMRIISTLRYTNSAYHGRTRELVPPLGLDNALGAASTLGELLAAQDFGDRYRMVNLNVNGAVFRAEFHEPRVDSPPYRGIYGLIFPAGHDGGVVPAFAIENNRIVGCSE